MEDTLPSPNGFAWIIINSSSTWKWYFGVKFESSTSLRTKHSQSKQKVQVDGSLPYAFLVKVDSKNCGMSVL